MLNKDKKLLQAPSADSNRDDWLKFALNHAEKVGLISHNDRVVVFEKIKDHSVFKIHDFITQKQVSATWIILDSYFIHSMFNFTEKNSSQTTWLRVIPFFRLEELLPVPVLNLVDFILSINHTYKSPEIMMIFRVCINLFISSISTRNYLPTWGYICGVLDLLVCLLWQMIFGDLCIPTTM